MDERFRNYYTDFSQKTKSYPIYFIYSVVTGEITENPASLIKLYSRKRAWLINESSWLTIEDVIDYIFLENKPYDRPTLLCFDEQSH